MRFSDLGLKMGDMMQLQISPESDARYPVRLLGYLPDCSIMISAPSEGKARPIFLKEEQMVTLRFVVNHVASGFNARVIKMQTTPRAYVHLKMPDQVEAVEVRNAVRVTSDITCTAVNETHNSSSMTVHLTNLSVLGGRIESSRKIALINDELSLTFTLLLDEVQKTLTIPVKVRNKGKIKSKETGEELNWYGFDFTFSDDEDRLLLKAFVYQEILRSMHLL